MSFILAFLIGFISGVVFMFLAFLVYAMLCMISDYMEEKKFKRFK
jgi:hypothetical protein